MNRIKEILGKNAATFTTSVVQLVASNKQLADCEPNSVLGSAMTAATLNLPINQNLGYAYVVPYNEKQEDGSYVKKAQFQIGYKGFIQLAQRSGMYTIINPTDVREGEIKHYDRLSGRMEFEWIQDEKERNEKKVIGYVSYFELVNGFQSTFYMTIEDINNHAKRFSKTYSHTKGLWKTDLPGMSKKTVIKLNLSKYGPLSIEMQKAILTDQATINDLYGHDLNYIDATPEAPLDPDKVSERKERERIVNHIESSTTIDVLEQVEDFAVAPELKELYNKKKNELSTKK